MSQVAAPYSALRWDRTAGHCVHTALDVPFVGRRCGVHLRCGAGAETQNWQGFRTCTWTGIEPDAELCAAAKQQPFVSTNSVDRFFADGGDPLGIKTPLRRDFTFRCEPISRTSIPTGSVQHIVWEVGHRGDDDVDAVVEEICRFGEPGATVVIVCYHVIEIESFAINDRLRPALTELRRRMRRSYASLQKLGLREVGRGEVMYAEGCFNLRELTRHFEEEAAFQRLHALRGWTSLHFFNHAVRKAWGRWNIRRNVRRRIRVFVGKVPSDLNELRRARRA